MIVEQLCSAYHWPLKEAMALTMPQLIMISHASHVNHKRLESKRKKGPAEEDPDDPMVTVGAVTKRFSQLTPEELDLYYSQM